MSRETLLGLLQQLPASAMLPVDFIREHLTSDAEEASAPEGGRSFSIAEVAAHSEIRRSANTVRGWIRDGHLRAYPFGREQRVTHAALLEFIEARRSAGRVRQIVEEAEAVSLGGWRDLRPAA